MESRTLIPQPPFDSTIDPTVQFWVTAFMAAAAVAALIYSLIHWRRSGKPTFLLLFMAGGVMMLLEPMVDTVGGCWHHTNSWVGFRAYGRILPVWLCLCYFFYFGIGVGVSWQLMRRGMTSTQLWMLFAAAAFGDFAMEVTLLHFDTWVYYGWQPLRIFKFPTWWAPVNALITMAAAATVFLFQAQLQRGWRQLLIIPVAVSVSAAVNCLAGWPSWLVINSDLGWTLTQLGGLATFAISIWVMWMIVGLTASDVRAAEETHRIFPPRVPAGA